MSIDVSYGGAAIAGLVSFLSPCVLPLVPPYLCYMAGVSLDQLTGTEAEERVERRVVLLSSVAFVLGFATIFVSLGASASAIGKYVLALSGYTIAIPFVDAGGAPVELSLVGLVAGAVIIVMGLHFLGVFHIHFLARQYRVEHNHPAGPLGSYVMGLAFAFGWTPCIGPVLAAILGVAGTEATVARGATLLAAYSAGLGIPFLLAGFFAGPFMHFMRRFRGHLGTVEKVMGGFLVLTGVLFITGGIANVSYWLLETFPALGQIG